MNIDDLADLDEAARKEIEELMKVTRERDGDIVFSEVQAVIGELLLANNKREKAIEFWSKVQHSDNPELYAKLQINIGIIFKEESDIGNTVKAWSKVQRSDSKEIYATANFYIGSLLSNIDNSIEAVEFYKNIKREDDLKIFVESQFKIASIYFDMNSFDNAINHWDYIKRSDDSLAYAKAQFSIGSILKNENENDKALLALDKINRSDSAEIFAKAQFNRGCILIEKGCDELALSAWRSIEKIDDPEAFAKAKFNIGALFDRKGKIDDALTELSFVNREDSEEVFALAKFNIGCELNNRGDMKGALLAWNSIERLDYPEVYAKAKVKTGLLLERVKRHEEAVDEWSKVKRSDNPEAYAIAQANIGYLQFENPQIAKQAFINIESTDSSRIYAHAQFKLGMIFIEEDNIEEAKKSFDIAKNYYPYETYCCKKICSLIEDKELKFFGLKFFDLLNTALNIVEILTLNFKKYDDEEKLFERKLAHYTSTYTSNLLIGNDKKSTSPSLFRLNTINNVNDPSEGQLLIRKLKGINDNIFVPLDFDKDFHAFISCFTFNHDSLNQFRLYGKQDNKEASGVSLVFCKEFFQSESFIGGISYLSIDRDIRNAINDPHKNSENLHSIKIESFKDEEQDKEVMKHAVMRCVYLDPTSDYFHLAQRNRLTFFREFGDKTILKDGTWQCQAEYEWNLYKRYIEEITNNFKEIYETLKIIYREVEKEIDNIRDNISESQTEELINFVDEILLPLKYLIKHSAFREEQECRMIYITSIDRPEVTMEYGSFLYVEYEPSVKDHLDKIYIAPAALHHKRYFDHLLKDIDVPVEVSGNVFR